MSTAALSTPPKQRSYLARTEMLWLAVVALVYLAVAVRSARLHPFVFHEFSTLFVSSTPTAGEMFRAIPADGNPPLYFILARLSLMLPIRTELALRLPAMFALVGAGLTVFWFVRRNVGPTPALFAMSVFLGCSIGVYAIDARPYPLLLLFTGLALCCWQAYCRSASRFALAGIALSIAGAVFSHQYGVIYTLFPLFAAEVVRSLRRRKIDAAVWIAGVIGSVTVLLTFPPMLRGQKPLLDAIRTCPVFSARPHLSDLKYFGAFLPRFVPVLVIFAAVIFLLWTAVTQNKESSATAAEIPAEDWAAVMATTLLLPVMLVVARLGTNYFQARYGIGSGLGMAMLCGMLVSRPRWRHAASLTWMATGYSLFVGLISLWLSAKPPGVSSWNDPVLRVGGFEEPIVVANAMEFSPLWRYSDGQMRTRVHYLTDLSYTARQSGLVPEYSLMLERAYLPMRLDDYQAWLSGRTHFLLYCSGDSGFEWIRRRLVDEGWRLTLLQSAPAVKAPGAKVAGNREMYEVSR